MTKIEKSVNLNNGFNERWGNSVGQKKQEAALQISTESGFCSLCGAWRGELGQEPTIELYITHLMMIFDEVRRVLRKDGVCFVNIGDSYSNPTTGGNGATGGRDKSTLASKMPPIGTTPTKKHIQPAMPKKSLMAIPAHFQIAMIDRGWICRNEIVWWKRNCMPSSVEDRFTVDFEPVYFFTKSERYWFHQQKEPTATKDDSVRDRDGSKLNNCPGRTRMGGLKTNNYDERNLRTVWDIPTESFPGSHFAVFPQKLAERMILAGCPPQGIVLDCFSGSGTSGMVARILNRNYILIELNTEYAEMARQRIASPLADFRETKKTPQLALAL